MDLILTIVSTIAIIAFFVYVFMLSNSDRHNGTAHDINNNGPPNKKTHKSFIDYFVPHPAEDWNQWSVSTHHIKGQYSRFLRACSEDIVVINNDYPAIVQGTTDTYTTSFKSCTCKDFRKREIPCKHMYKLALTRNLISKSFLKIPILPPDAFDLSDPPDDPIRNYAKYKIRGINSLTNRKKTFVVTVRNQKGIAQAAKNKGLLEPIEILERILPDFPSEDQLGFAKNVGFYVTSDMYKQDVSCMLSRWENNHLEDVPDIFLARYLDRQGVHFSRYIGIDGFEEVLQSFWMDNPREKLAYFAFSVYQKHAGLHPMCFFDSPKVRLFYVFADSASDQAKKYVKRTDINMISPSPKSKAFSEVLQILHLK